MGKEIRNMPKNQYIREVIQGFEQDKYPNLKIVQSGQTIQAVIDSCPVAVGSLKEGFTNPQVVKVPPGHEKEYYSLVRNAADDASDKRNVKIIFEDNPEGKFIADQFDACDSVGDWVGIWGTTIELDTTRNFEGSHGFKVYRDGNSIMDREFSPSLDLRKYQALLVDIELDPSEVDGFTLNLYNNGDQTIAYNYYTNVAGLVRNTISIPLFSTNNAFVIDLSAITKMRIVLQRKSGVSGVVTGYVDNMRFIRTTPYRAIILRFDDIWAEQWNIGAKLLDAKGWKGSYVTTLPYNMGAATTVSIQQLKAMDDNGYDIINHTIDHLYFTDLDSSDSHYEYTGMQRFLDRFGLSRAARIFTSPGHKYNKYIKDIVQESGAVIMDNKHNTFPVVLGTFSDPGFAIPTEIQRFIDSGQGGIVQGLFHRITNETTFSDRLDWIEENFSEIILASELVERLPDECKKTPRQQRISGFEDTLTGDFRLYFYHGEEVHLDPGGGARNVIPVGSNPYGESMEFRPFHRIELINTADAAEALTFDPTFTSAGNHDAAAHDTIMTDSGESWVVGQLVGRTINNTPDGSSGVITANTATTITAVLSGGTSNDWQNGEAYTITPAGLNQTVGEDQRATFVYDGAGWDIVNLYDKTP